MPNKLFVLNSIKSAKHSPSSQAVSQVQPSFLADTTAESALPCCLLPSVMPDARTQTASHLHPLLIPLFACLLTLWCSGPRVHYRSLLACVTPHPTTTCLLGQGLSSSWFYLFMLRMTLSSGSSCLCFLSAGVIGVCHHTWLLATIFKGFCLTFLPHHWESEPRGSHALGKRFLTEFQPQYGIPL